LWASAPYKGFYERPDALAEGDRLKKKGYDVIVRAVDALSTLGFTKNPIMYSFMKKYFPYKRASTIIHEQTQATL
jgi:predicted aminopeptidase